MLTVAVEKQTTLTRWLERLTSPGQLAERAKRTVDLAFTSTDERFIWVTDHGERVGLIDTVEALFEWVAPHPGIDTPRPREVPAIYHAPTFQGGRIIAQWWLCGTMSGERRPALPWRTSQDAPAPQGDDVENRIVKTKPKMVWHFENGGGDSLRFSIAHTYAHDGSILGEHAFTLSYDPLADSYVADVAATLSAPNHYLIECCNFYTGVVPGVSILQFTMFAEGTNSTFEMVPATNDTSGATGRLAAWATAQGPLSFQHPERLVLFQNNGAGNAKMDMDDLLVSSGVPGFIGDPVRVVEEPTDGTEISFPSEVAKTYQAQFSDDGGTTWFDLGPRLRGNGETIATIDARTPGRIYQVLDLRP